ncbi:MAG: hypothetical protein ABW061_25690 [Polyangiaceae bacterium]
MTITALNGSLRTVTERSFFLGRCFSGKAMSDAGHRSNPHAAHAALLVAVSRANECPTPLKIGHLFPAAPGTQCLPEIVFHAQRYFPKRMRRTISITTSRLMWVAQVSHLSRRAGAHCLSKIALHVERYLRD